MYSGRFHLPVAPFIRKDTVLVPRKSILTPSKIRVDTFTMPELTFLKGGLRISLICTLPKILHSYLVQFT